MGVENNNYTINNLTTSNTFYDWYTKTNNEIIAKLNYITMYQGLSGDGVVVGITAAGGQYGFSIAPTIQKGITFNGPITFTNTVSFNSAIDLSTITLKFPINTGVTSGNIVRVNTTNGGLTFAVANSDANAEVLGIVSHNTATETVVKIAGTIDNTQFAQTIGNMLKVSGGTLSPGTVYFLDSTNYGGITVNDQTTYGTVSKPVILGITGNKGCILPYRGISNTGVTGGLTADLDNNSYTLQLWTTTHLNGTNPTTSINNIKIGSYVFLPKNFSTWVTGTVSQVGETNCLLAMSKTSSSTTTDFVVVNDLTCALAPTVGVSPAARLNSNNDYVFFGVVSKIYNKNSGTGNVTLQITTDGGGFVVSDFSSSNFSALINNPLTNAYRSALNFNNSSSDNKFFTRNTAINNTTSTTANPEGYGIVGIPVSSTSAIIRVIRTSYGRNTIPVTSISAGFVGGGEGEDGGTDSTRRMSYALAPLASGLSGGLEYDNLLINGGFDVWQRGYSAVTGLSSKCTAVADRWFHIDRDYATSGITHGKVVTNYSITRQEFTPNQTDVFGSPRYYLNLVHQYSGITGYNKPRLENVTYNPYQFQANTMTLSFYARSGITGGTLACYYTQYQDLNTFTTQESVNSITTVQLGSTWNRYSVPFTISPPGFTAATSTSGLFGIGFEFISDPQGIDLANVRLDMGENPGYDLPVDMDKEIQRCGSYYFKTYPHDVYPGTANSTTHCELTLGNLLTVKNYSVKYPVKTIATPRSITLYSNVSGDINEAYNASAGNDMKMTGGSAAVCPWSAALRSYRVAKLNAPTIVVSSYNTSQMIVNIQNGAFSLDTLQFHYVIDADVYMTN